MSVRFSIEKVPTSSRRGRTGLTGLLLKLPPGNCLRVTTARDAYLLGGLAGVVKRHGFMLRRQLDGDDLLVWLEKL